jgi:hypothetical protein
MIPKHRQQKQKLINGITPNKSSVQQRGQSTVKRQLAKCRKYLQTICPAKATTNIQKKKAPTPRKRNPNKIPQNN